MRLNEIQKLTGYRIVVERLSDDEDDGYVARVPAMPGCELFGDTEEDALSGLVQAIAGWKAMARKLHRKVPEPDLAHA